MANDYKTYVDGLYGAYTWTKWELEDAEVDLSAAWVFWDISSWKTCIQKMLWAMAHMIESTQMMIGEGTSHGTEKYLYDALTEAWQYTIEDFPEVTYKSIVEAWIKDDFEGRDITIAVIDRMRQILWDEPFSVVWAARPEEQE